MFVSGKEYKTFVLLYISVCLFRAKRLFVSFFLFFGRLANVSSKKRLSLSDVLHGRAGNKGG